MQPTRALYKSLATMAVLTSLGACSVATSTPRFNQPRAERIDIPPGQMPPPGSCRVWHPGEPPGQQPEPGDCEELEKAVPVGAWLLFRPDSGRRVLRIV